MTQQKLVHFFLKKIYFDIFKYTNRMKTTSFSTKKYFFDCVQCQHRIHYRYFLMN
ncbi:unnamed protein product [Acanthoscelides obtectus]|uniref:Uncharacterized protein n=2 Tax=Acanthoscelides obtectus TaxID=200917 RepID=A0A9P0LB36_ACAOB|nr:unnamed protein product [Acanthoscelides obtectus]CAH1993357.1 unnamed protein product [Acanthoscelides obtectus]CAH1994603.1 unnamed protein product [Acanthoscelides obtectus]CAK1626569.1 hypothetical protein AOBTE_LOCUS3939 [Acanthoscelides obtectus]CAK1640454.1 hypothetical protein AOBTE_LOCUS11732 [Acanthoscelides obtectus]